MKLDMETLYVRRQNLNLKFAIKSTKNKKMNYMFPQKMKMHLMETRNPEKYMVQYANTERLKKSPIIFMQNLLNDYEHSVKC